jgi:Pyridoxal-dependent decarboxylase, C-terminal sheet domain
MQIVYNGPAKSPESIREAIAGDIQLLCVNHRGSLPRAQPAPPTNRFGTGSSHDERCEFLLASVVTTNRAAETTYAVLDAGINLAESVRSENHQLLPVNRYGEPATRVHTIVGPICSPGDTLYQAIRLPELKPRDSVAVMDSGAYFVPFATSFSFPRPAILLINAGHEQLLRRAEQFEDLVAYDLPPLSTPQHDLSVEQYGGRNPLGGGDTLPAQRLHNRHGARRGRSTSLSDCPRAQKALRPYIQAPHDQDRSPK